MGLFANTAGRPMKYTEFTFKHWFTIAMLFPLQFIAGSLGGFSRPRVEEICEDITQAYPLYNANKGPNQFIVDLNQNGLVLNNTGNTLTMYEKFTRNVGVTEHRATLVNKVTAQMNSLDKRIEQAALKSMSQEHVSFKQEDNVALNQIRVALRMKYKILTSALMIQNGNQYGNCGEHADITLAHYFKELLTGHEKGQIQHFVLELNSGSAMIDNHAFTVIDSGIPAQVVTLNAKKVEELMNQVSNNQESYLCDAYNHEKGSFGEIRNHNKAYGKNSSHRWNALQIYDITPDLDLSKIPPHAKTLIKELKQMNNDINEMFIKNINKPKNSQKSKVN